MPSSNPWYIRARLRTRQLMLLIAIEEEGNIHRAAVALYGVELKVEEEA